MFFKFFYTYKMIIFKRWQLSSWSLVHWSQGSHIIAGSFTKPLTNNSSPSSPHSLNSVPHSPKLPLNLSSKFPLKLFLNLSFKLFLILFFKLSLKIYIKLSSMLFSKFSFLFQALFQGSLKLSFMLSRTFQNPQESRACRRLECMKFLVGAKKHAPCIS